jgi:hypothetical protein
MFFFKRSQRLEPGWYRLCARQGTRGRIESRFGSLKVAQERRHPLECDQRTPIEMCGGCTRSQPKGMSHPTCRIGLWRVRNSYREVRTKPITIKICRPQRRPPSPKSRVAPRVDEQMHKAAE